MVFKHICELSLLLYSLNGTLSWVVNSRAGRNAVIFSEVPSPGQEEAQFGGIAYLRNVTVFLSCLYRSVAVFTISLSFH